MVVDESKPVFTPRSGKALLVIMRTASFNGDSRIDNYLDGKMIGQTLGKTYFTTEVTPGTHYITSRTENTDTARLNFEQGRIYVLLQGVYPGWVMTARYSPMTNEEFQRELPETVFSSYDKAHPGKDLSAGDLKRAREDFEREVKGGEHKEILEFRGYRKLK